MAQEAAFFSVIVPTYMRPERLRACLEAFASLSYPRDRFEVIVVDDGSERPPESAVAAFSGRIDARLVSQPHSGPAGARNRGTAEARGEILAFSDDDCAPAPDWLDKLATRFSAMPDCAVGGRTLNALPDNVYSHASQLLIDYLYSYYNADPDEARFFTSNNLALPAHRFRAIGGFDPSFKTAGGEDRDLCARWLHAGYKVIYAPEALVYHAHPLTPRSLWRQYFGYGRGAYYFYQARARSGMGGFRLEPLAFYLNMLRYPFLRAPAGEALRVSAVVALARVASVTGHLWERARHRAALLIGARVADSQR